MPGSIRVSVLEAFDLPETLADNEDVVIKVAIGTREHQTPPNKAVGGKTTPWNLDFDFPVLNLRDNLSVTLLDSKGEAISKNEIDTPSIVEKGSFDVNLLLNGGGNVHVCLSFVLTDEERRRIDVMRAAALQRREQQASKLTAASTQSMSVQGESEVGSSELQSSPGKSLEKDMDKDKVPKGISVTGSQKVDASQIKPILAATQDDVSLFVEQEPPGIVDSTVADIALPNQDLSDPLTVEERSMEDQKVVYLDKSDISPTGQEENEDLTDNRPDANLKPTSSGVKAKIKAFEKTRPQSATKQNHTLSPNSKIQKFSSHSMPSSRKKMEVEEVKVGSSNHDFESCRIKNKPPEPSNQMGVGPDKSVLLKSVVDTCEAGSIAKEQNCPVVPTRRPEDNELIHIGSTDYLESNKRGSEREVTAQRQFSFGELAQDLATVGVQDNDLGFKPTETELPQHEETKASSMQGSKSIDLVGLSKQVLSGAVSGAVVIAACALLWAAKPKRRNSSILQRSKQRKRK